MKFLTKNTFKQYRERSTFYAYRLPQNASPYVDLNFDIRFLDADNIATYWITIWLYPPDQRPVQWAVKNIVTSIFLTLRFDKVKMNCAIFNTF